MTLVYESVVFASVVFIKASGKINFLGFFSVVIQDAEINYMFVFVLSTKLETDVINIIITEGHF